MIRVHHKTNGLNRKHLKYLPCIDTNGFTVNVQNTLFYYDYLNVGMSYSFSGGSLAALVVIALVAFYVSSMCRIVKTYSVNEKKKIPSNEHGHVYGSVNDNSKL